MRRSENGTYIMSLNKPAPMCPTVAYCSQTVFTAWGDLAASIDLQPETSIKTLNVPGFFILSRGKDALNYRLFVKLICNKSYGRVC